MPRRNPAQRANAAIARVLAQLEKKRAEVAALEATVAEMTAALTGAVQVKRAPQSLNPELAAMVAQHSDPLNTGPQTDLAPQDSQGEGRWI